MENPMELAQDRILITGASSGIGRAIAVRASQLGASVVISGRSVSGLEETKALCTDNRCLLIPFDLSVAGDLESLLEQSTKEGRLTGLVHSAGICPILSIQSLSYEKMISAFQVNYFAFMELVKNYSKRKYSSGGSIVAISSVSSFEGRAGTSVYCGTKGALDASIRALATELARKGIRVNSVVPSFIDTEMLRTTGDVAGTDLQKVVFEKQPLGLGRPEDVANAVAFLLSDASRFITGTSLVVDGGYMAQ